MRLLTNDGTHDEMRPLVQLKAIFSKQLPKMPPEYIVRLVFDRKHVSLALFKGSMGKGKVVGGICFRPCVKQRFAEIAFCAVTATEQVKGFGTLLMNHLKQCVKTRDVRWFLTYADNYAIGYFEKQGFCREQTIKKEQWDGYLKDYDGATLLQCEIHSEIDYTDTKGMLRRQKENIYRMLAEKLGAKVVHDGTKEGHRLDDPFDVPGVQSAGWTKEFVERIESEQRAITSLQSQLKSILDDLMNTKFVWPYLKEVDAEKYPEYRNVVKDPIDLNIIRARLESGVYYTTKRIFRDEIKLMCENCKLFNVNPLSQYHMTALKVEEFVMPRLAAIDI